MCLATNGTLVTEEICRQIKELEIKMVSLSLDGARPKPMTISAISPAPSTAP